MDKSLKAVFVLAIFIGVLWAQPRAWATLKQVPLPTHLRCFGQLQEAGQKTTIPPQPNEIGRGNMSVITKEKKDDRWIAVKTMNEDQNFKDADWENIKAGVTIAQELNAQFGDASPVVNVHSFERHGNSATIKMDFLEGDNLHVHYEKLFLKEGLNSKSLAQALDLASGVFYNVDTLARAKILNPDLKAANIMVTKNANGAVVTRIIDPESLVRINPATNGLDKFPTFVSAVSPEMGTFHHYKEMALREGFSETVISMFGQNVGTSSMYYSLGLFIQAEILKPFQNAIAMREPLEPRVVSAIEELEKITKRLLEKYPTSRATASEASIYIDRIRSLLRRP